MFEHQSNITTHSSSIILRSPKQSQWMVNVRAKNLNLTKEYISKSVELSEARK